MREMTLISITNAGRALYDRIHHELSRTRDVVKGAKENCSWGLDYSDYCVLKAPLKEGLEYFAREGFVPISTEEVAFLRTKIGLRNRVGHNIRTGESFVFYPSGEILITDREMNPLIQIVSRGIDLSSRKLEGHCGYSIDDKVADDLMERARLEAHTARETGVLLLPKPDSSTGYCIETEYLATNQITKFLLGKSLEIYKRSLRNDKLRLKPNHPNPFPHLCDPEFIKGVQDYLLGRRKDLPYGDEEQVMPDWNIDLGIQKFMVWAVPQTRWGVAPYNFVYACSSTILSPMDPLWKTDRGIDGSNLIMNDYAEATMIGFRKLREGSSERTIVRQDAFNKPHFEIKSQDGHLNKPEIKPQRR